MMMRESQNAFELYIIKMKVERVSLSVFFTMGPTWH
jgi:hypothetical protein